MHCPDDPLDGITPTCLATTTPLTEHGRFLRQTDARLVLEKLNATDAEHSDAMRELEQVEDILLRQRIESRLNVQHLLQFGVSLAERNEFRELLHETVMHGGLTLREAAQLSFARCLSRGDDAFRNEPGLPNRNSH